MSSPQTGTLFSGMQPTGYLTIANYAGALRNWVRLQKTHDCIFSVVDLHAITLPHDPGTLRERSHDFLALYVACGIDPRRSMLVLQSQVPEHGQLAWILGCCTGFGELRRMAQFKEKSAKNPKSVTAGLFSYPVLMAADILLYQTDLVPVGEDQKQHVELTRNIAQRFNSRFGAAFSVPQPFIPETGARVRSLKNPDAKMSKTDPNPATYIALLDPPDVVRKKIQGAVTGSDGGYSLNEGSGIANLITLFSVVSGGGRSTLAEAYTGLGYAQFKDELVERINEFLHPIQKRYREIRGDAAMMRDIVADGTARARLLAKSTLDAVYDRIGFVRPGDAA